MTNKAKEIIVPSESRVFRIVFLYVGQGDATLLVIPEGDDYKYVLIDSNKVESDNGGLDLMKLLEDLFDEDNELSLYINTHPHKDHLGLVKDIYKKIGFNQLWHSGHKPGGDHKDAYKDLEYVIKKLGDENVFVLNGSKEENKVDEEEIVLGDINYNVLAPAEYVSEEIEDEDPDDRYKRIHEQCAVLRFKYGSTEAQILITGDADYDAWKNHITDYHKDRLASTVLSAAHHGSRTFFWKGDPKDEDPYEDHLDAINPQHVVVSAPKTTESPHEHPHKEAMDLYKEKVGKDNVYHLGKNRECVIVDIKEDGELSIFLDKELVKSYGSDNEKKENAKSTSAPAILKDDARSA